MVIKQFSLQIDVFQCNYKCFIASSHHSDQTFAHSFFVMRVEPNPNKTLYEIFIISECPINFQ